VRQGVHGGGGGAVWVLVVVVVVVWLMVWLMGVGVSRLGAAQSTVSTHP